MGVLFDLASAHSRYGYRDAVVLRGAARAEVRATHRWICLVLLHLRHHPRPRRHLDCKIRAPSDLSKLGVKC